MTFSTGLCSVTLRHLTVPQVVDVVAAAGLTCCEWGADGHVRPGDVRAAADARDRGLDQGVRVASYGSYFRADTAADFPPVLASAVALGAPRIRIWAGSLGSADSDQRDGVVAVVREAADRAADAGVQLAVEYHGGTLTDTPESTLRLLSDVDRPNVATYWQPPQSLPDAAALADLDRVLPWVAAVHVFSWWPGDHRLALDARAALWTGVVDRLRGTGRDYDALLEFVPDDDVARVPVDAATLAGFVR